MSQMQECNQQGLELLIKSLKKIQVGQRPFIAYLAGNALPLANTLWVMF